MRNLVWQINGWWVRYLAEASVKATDSLVEAQVAYVMKEIWLVIWMVNIFWGVNNITDCDINESQL